MLTDRKTEDTYIFRTESGMKNGREPKTLRLQLPSRRVWIDLDEVKYEALIKARDVWRQHCELVSLSDCAVDLQLHGEGFTVRIYSAYSLVSNEIVRPTNSLNYIELDTIGRRSEIIICNTTPSEKSGFKGCLEYFLDSVDEMERFVASRSTNRH